MRSTSIVKPTTDGGVIVIIRMPDISRLPEILEALRVGGMPRIEITFGVPDYETSLL
jgi:2-keto-3-deoxy-6-phosphogluconate aldolase